MITEGTRVRCDLESRGAHVTVEGEVIATTASRFAVVRPDDGGAAISLPVTDLVPLSAEIIPFCRAVRGREDGPGAAA
jgi:hypothetical protein